MMQVWFCFETFVMDKLTTIIFMFIRNVVYKMQSICLEEAGVSGSLAEDSTLMGLTFGGYLRSKVSLHVDIPGI